MRLACGGREGGREGAYRVMAKPATAAIKLFQ